MQIYVFWRGASVPFFRRPARQKALFAAGALLWAGFVFGRMQGHTGAGGFARFLELSGMDWLGTVFLLFVCVLAADAVTVFGFVLPRLAPSLRGCALLAGAAFSAFAVVQGTRPPVVQPYEVRLAGLPADLDGTVVVALSDTHLGSLLGREWLRARVAQVQAQRPDLIVLLGDIGEGHGGDREELLPLLKGFSAPLGVWAVSGNHESHGGRRADGSLLAGSGVPILHNRWAELRPGLVLAGVDDLTAYHRSERGGDPVTQALAGRPRGATILLSHTPWEAEKAARAGAGLMLCGHTHGGQIWPFGFLVRRRYPLLEGSYDVGGMTAIVCRGTGTWGPRMRFWRPGEILRITLRSAQ
jgi:predicted MPP superfamily phosphohydrolase